MSSRAWWPKFEVLHGLSAVAELKLEELRDAARRLQRSPRPQRRGRIEALALVSDWVRVVEFSTASAPWPN